MKTTIHAGIDKAVKDGGEVTLTLTGKGKTATSNINAQDASFSGSLTLKALVANAIPLGARITITVTDEKTEE